MWFGVAVRALSLLESVAQKHPSGPEDYADSNPIENRVEKGPCRNNRNANESRFDCRSSPCLVPVHSKSILNGVESLRLGSCPNSCPIRCPNEGLCTYAMPAMTRACHLSVNGERCGPALSRFLVEGWIPVLDQLLFEPAASPSV